MNVITNLDVSEHDLQSTNQAVRRIAVTGANGFLGLHVRAALREQGIELTPVAVGKRFDKQAALRAVDGAEALLHLAGVNRGSESDVAKGNRTFSSQIAQVLQEAKRPPLRVSYANSIHASSGSIYGAAKAAAGEILEDSTRVIGAAFDNVILPNLFGEYGEPFYNSVVATFSHLTTQNKEVTIDNDKELTLLHAADAADMLIGAVSSSEMSSLTHRETVSGIAALLKEFSDHYSAGEFPDLSTAFRRNLFNTYRAHLWPMHLTVPITVHRDNRGGFFEITRARGGTGQTSLSTTEPGISRGDHFHRRKVERFTVVSGSAEIRLRRFDQKGVHVVRVDGDEPMSVDMPTLVAHEIRNVGGELLNTVFWTNDIFDPQNPDTIAEVVE